MSLMNPWQVESLSAFNFLCCPECVYRSKEEIAFQDHALTNHPQSKTFFHGAFMAPSSDEFGEAPPLDNLPLDLPLDLPIKKEPSDENVDVDQFCQKDMVVKEEDNGQNDDDPADDYNDESYFMDDGDDADEEEIVPKKRARRAPARKLKVQKEEPKEGICAICNSNYDETMSLDEHILAEHLDSDGLVKCNEPDCDEKTADYPLMVIHKGMKHQMDKATHDCHICKKIFTKKVRLRKHIESVHEKRKVNCPQCNKEVGIHSLNGHIKYNHTTDRTVKPFKCEECDYKTSHALNLKQHIVQIHRKETHQFACDQCDRKYAMLSQLKQHKQIKHEGLKPYMCDQCGKSWRPDAKFLFLNHVQNGCKANMYPDGIKCPSCEVTFSVEGNYIKHHMKVHGGLPPGYTDKEMFICEICSTICINKKALRAHVASNHDEKAMAKKKRHACPHCEKTFACKQACGEHVKAKHEGYTPFKCDQCHRSYGTQYGLKAHKFSMHQRIKCDECGQEVSNTLILTRHKAKAHGIKPANSYQCNYCPLFYTLETQLEKHVMNHHMNQFE